jgi:Xaa-Pro aminopeptidase
MQRLINIAILTSITVLFSQVTPDEFNARRQTVIEQLNENEVMVVFTEPYVIRNGDGEHNYRPNSDFWYLTGIGESNAVLVLSGSPRTIALDSSQYSGREFLFLNERNPKIERWIGKRLGLDGAKLLKIANALPITTFTSEFSDMFSGIDTVYSNNPSDVALYPGAAVRPPIANADTMVQWLAGKNPSAKKKSKHKPKARAIIKAVDRIIAPMRQIKSPAEIDLMQQVIDLTGAGIMAAMERAEGGLYEYQLQATLEAVFTEGGSPRRGFQSIIASGPNALILHYMSYGRQSKPGELVLMDVGAEVGMYSADISRTFPLDGKFTEAQAEVYDVVLGAEAAAISAIRPGVTFKELDEIAKDYIVEAGYEKYIRHGISHFLGLDAHDVGLRKEPLKAGSVITIEPGLYIPVDAMEIDAAYRGMGIRIEDDVLVTETGFRVLSQNIPKTIAEIEGLMTE